MNILLSWLRLLGGLLTFCGAWWSFTVPPEAALPLINAGARLLGLSTQG